MRRTRTRPRRSGMLRSHTVPSSSPCMLAVLRDERLAASRERTAPGAVPRQLSGRAWVRGACLFPWSQAELRSRDRNEPRGHVLSSRRQTFLRSMEELVTDLSLDLKKGLSVKLRNSNKTLASLTAGRVEKVRVDGVRDAMFGATFPAAAELPRR